MQYRRIDIAGGTYFFTVNLAERKRTLLINQTDALRKASDKSDKTTHLPFGERLWICWGSFLTLTYGLKIPELMIDRTDADNVSILSQKLDLLQIQAKKIISKSTTYETM